MAFTQQRAGCIGGLPRQGSPAVALVACKKRSAVLTRRTPLGCPAIHVSTDTQTDEVQATTTAANTSMAASGENSSPKYNWLQHWWPVLSLEMLHKDKPNAVTILGRQLVVWWDQPQAQWVVMEDSCPHRLTPLSQGRIVSPGQLTCSYHGWSFNAKGSCTTIPHLPADQPTTSKRSCVRTYPSRVVDKLLFAWLDNSPEGLTKSETVEPLLQPNSGTGDWGIQLVPNDWRFWVEQGQDPGHANFLHAGLAGFKSEDATSIDADPVTDLTLEGGFTMHHGGYEKKNAGMVAKRIWMPPCHVKTEYVYKNGLQIDFFIYFVPAAPGMTRTFFAMKTGAAPTPASTPDSASGTSSTAGSTDSATASAPAPAASSAKPSGAVRMMTTMMGLMQKFPHWLISPHRVTDQDVVAMALTEQVMRSKSQSDRDYYLATPSDSGVAAINRWMRLAGYEHLWQSVGVTAHTPPTPTLEQLLDRRTRHTDHCAVCQKGLRLLEKVSAVLKALSFAFGAGAAGLWAVALVPGGPGSRVLAAAAVATGVAVILAAAHAKVEDVKEERFISGVRAWKKVGGLSLVKEN